MPKPRKPQWNQWGAGRKGRWRSKINGTYVYNDQIPEDERPQIAGIPIRAWDWLREEEAKAKAKATQESDTGPLTVGGLLARYVTWADAERLSGGLSEGQAKGIKSRVRLFLHYSKAKQIRADQLTVDVLARTFADIRSEGYTPHYVAGVGRTIRAAFRWGAKPIAGRIPARLLAENPIAGYDFPRAPKGVKGYVEAATVRRFLRWAWGEANKEKGLKRHFDRIFILMLRFQRVTGCRPGEACDLRWTDIVWGDGKEKPRAVIPPNRQKTGKKTGKERVIYLTRPVIRILRFLASHPGRHETHVFTHMRGKGAEARGHVSAVAGEPWPSGSAASQKVGELRRAAIAARLEGIEDVGPKKLVAYANRHGYASESRALGMTSEQVAVMLGNTPEVVSQTYSHAVTRAEANLADEIAAKRRRSSR